MALKAKNLDDNIKSFENDDGTIATVDKSEINDYLHQEQEDYVEGETSARVKKFYDYINLHVFLPWLRAITNVLNGIKNAYLSKSDAKETYLEKTAAEKDYLRKNDIFVSIPNGESMRIVGPIAIAQAMGIENINDITEEQKNTKVFLRAKDTGDLFQSALMDLSYPFGLTAFPRESVVEQLASEAFLRKESAEADYLKKVDAENTYLGKDVVRDSYNAESEDPISGKGVKEALDGLPIRKGSGENSVETGEGTYAGSNAQRVAGKFNEKDFDEKYADIVGNGTGDSDDERSNAYTLDWEGNAVYAGSVSSKDGELTTKEKVIDSLFPPTQIYEEDITEKAITYALPSDDVKIVSETEIRYIYMGLPDLSQETQMYVKDSATSPFTFPDDLADQELAATMWKAGNLFEGGCPRKATLVMTKEQEDKTAISPTRLAEILENERVTIKEDIIGSFTLAEEVSV